MTLANEGSTKDEANKPASKNQRLWVLGTLYFSQGLPYGFFTQALPVKLRDQHVSLEAIGLTTFLALPWALKFLLAPWVDRFSGSRLGRRRGWILPLQGLTIVLSLVLSLFTENLPLLLSAVLLTNLLAATQDIATDALAVDMLAESERGLANGLQIAGYRAGMIVGGGALLVFYEQLGFTGTFRAMAILLTLATIPIYFHREPPLAPPQAREESAAPSPSYWVLALSLLKRPLMLRWLLVLAIYKSGEALASGMLRPLLRDRGLTMRELGLILGTAGFVSGLVGAMFGGYLAGRIGRRKSLLFAGAVQTLAVSTMLLPASGKMPMWVLYSVVSFEHVASGMATASLFTMMMDVCEGESAASDYTLQASLVVIATGAAVGLSGLSAGKLGYGAHYALATAVALLTFVAVAVLTRRLPARIPAS